MMLIIYEYFIYVKGAVVCSHVNLRAECGGTWIGVNPQYTQADVIIERSTFLVLSMIQKKKSVDFDRTRQTLNHSVGRA